MQTLITTLSNVRSERSLSVFLVISSAIWGFYWLPLRSIEATGMSGSWSVVFFNACPLVLLLPLLLFNARQLAGQIHSTGFAAVFLGSAFTLYANGLVETSVIRATMLFYLTPVWSTIIGVLWLGEPLTRARIVAILVAFTGLYLLLSNGDSSSQPLNIGDLYSFLSGVFWAIGLATLNRWTTIPILPLTALTFLSTTTISAFFAIVVSASPFPESGKLVAALPTALFWSIIVLLPCFFIIFSVSKVLFPGRVGILTMSEVVVAVISASVLLPGETMVLIQWVGAIAIVAAGLIEVVYGYATSQEKNNEKN